MNSLMKILEGVVWVILGVAFLAMGWGLASDSRPEWYTKEIEEMEGKDSK